MNVSSIDLLEWSKSLFPADELGEDAFGKAMAAAFVDSEQPDSQATASTHNHDPEDLDISALQFALSN